MSQPQALTTQQIQNYQNQIQNAGTLAQKKAAAIAVYQDLYAKGYNYAGWALGVATGDTITGTAALDYLTGSALMGLGNTEMSRNLTPAQVDKIVVDMAVNTMGQMKIEAGKTGGVLTKDLDYQPVEAVHKETFEKNGQSLDNWTLNTPMTLYRQAYGDAAADALWVQIRETGGDGFDGVMASTLLVTAMGKLAFESNDPNVRQQALAWMDQVPGTVDPQALARSANLIMQWLSPNPETPNPNGPTPEDPWYGSLSPNELSAQANTDQQLITGVKEYLKSQPVNNAPAATGLDTPTRNSSALINTTGANTTQFNSGGGVDDLWVVEKNAGRYEGTREQFRADFVASNGQVNPDTLVVQQNQTYFVPQRSANGNTVYHYTSGAKVMNNAVTGEYLMEVPNTDGSGGKTVYSRTADDVGYTVRQVTTNAAGTVVFEHQSYQTTLDAAPSPVNTNIVSGNQATSHNWVTPETTETKVVNNVTGEVLKDEVVSRTQSGGVTSQDQLNGEEVLTFTSGNTTSTMLSRGGELVNTVNTIQLPDGRTRVDTFNGSGVLQDSTVVQSFDDGSSMRVTNTPGSSVPRIEAYDPSGRLASVNVGGVTTTYFTDYVYQTDTFVGPPAPNQSPSSSSVNFGTVKYDMNDFNDRLDAEYQFFMSPYATGMSTQSRNSVTLDTSNFLLGGGSAFNTVKLPSSSNYVNPGNIGAFYESVSAGLDAAESIAAKTPVILDANLQGVSAAQLAARDAQGSGGGSGSGVLSGQELSGLSFWSDLNEDGFVDAGELTAVSSAVGSLLARDYGFYTGGNSQRGAGVAGTPVYGGVAPIVAVPNSNYRSLRDTDNRYWISGSRWIDFASNQVKVNNGTRNTLIGTDGNDKFDANYYANYAQWINSGLLVNFLAGGGNDQVGGGQLEPANAARWRHVA